jgi:hypothetical protein
MTGVGESVPSPVSPSISILSHQRQNFVFEIETALTGGTWCFK